MLAMKSFSFNSLSVIVLFATTFIPTIAIAQEDFALPIDDQARHLQNLENRSAEQWNFSSSNPPNLESYNFRASSQDIRLVEQKPNEWDNTGDSRNSSVLVDVYDFTPEDL